MSVTLEAHPPLHPPAISFLLLVSKASHPASSLHFPSSLLLSFPSILSRLQLIALVVTLALRRPEWTSPCSSNLATFLHLLHRLLSGCYPILDSHFISALPSFMGSLLFFPTAIAGGGCRCGHETWAATAPQPTSSSPSSATCTPMGPRAPLFPSTSRGPYHPHLPSVQWTREEPLNHNHLGRA